MRREPTFDDCEPDDDESEFRALDRARPFARTRVAAKIVFAAALITGLTIAAKGTMQPAQNARPWTDPPGAAPLARTALATPAGGPLLRLEPVAGEEAPRSKPPRWNAASGLREDALSTGRFDAIEAPFLLVTLTETGPDTDPPASLFLTLARRAAEMHGLSVLRTGLRGQVETKFGSFEIVETSLSGQGTRACTGFRLLSQDRTRIDGWLCGLLGQAPEAREVGCALDRLTLASRAGERLETVFADAEARRGPGCGPVEAARSPRADATGSIGNLKPKPEAKARLKK